MTTLKLSTTTSLRFLSRSFRSCSQQKNVLHLLKQKKTALLAKQKLLQPKEYVRIHMFFAEDGEDEGDVYDIPLQDGKVLVTDLQFIDSQVVSLSYWIPEKNRSRLLIPDQMGAITAPKNGWNANKLYAWMC
ncbi:hypothetical protein L596_022812 [Steinernema carpocapsae]|uniref:Uncharacterized protein n=2 Tax=Steinernema carpocapsae TaxID=34508 RepID=A0A4U5MMV7_STECR|nr:hypothetical protein L596_022812 [Steinernema carpocapsae]